MNIPMLRCKRHGPCTYMYALTFDIHLVNSPFQLAAENKNDFNAFRTLSKAFVRINIKCLHIVVVVLK